MKLAWVSLDEEPIQMLPLFEREALSIPWCKLCYFIMRSFMLEGRFKIYYPFAQHDIVYFYYPNLY